MIDFDKSNLSGAEALSRPTSLQFGPDDRLYVSQQNGLIRVFDIVRNSSTDYTVVSEEVITLIQDIPNHDDDGTPNPVVDERLVTGLLVTGTPQSPVIYVTSSDPRIGGGNAGTDLNLDTNSSILSRLTWNGTTWDKLDLVRGLPRSEENHALNGMALDETTNTLYVTAGGNTNMGATSNNFALPAGVRLLGGDPLGRPGRHRRGDLRPSDPSMTKTSLASMRPTRSAATAARTRR